MKNLVVCVSVILASLHELQAAADDSGKGTSGREGAYVGLGLNISRQQTSCDANRDFVGASSEVRSTPFGVAAIAGYDRRICGNFSIGVEAGVDLGSNGKKHGIGSVFSKDSARFRDMGRSLNNLFNVIGANLGMNAAFANAAAGGVGNTVHAAVYTNFVNTLRYIGGADVALNNAFITGPSAGGIWNAAPNANATFADFTVSGSNAMDAFGGADIGSIRLLQEFVTTYYPNLAAILRGLNDNGGAVLQGDVASDIAQFFVNADLVVGGANAANISASTIAEMQSARKMVNDCIHNIRKAADNGSASFGVCSHLAVKIGYRMPDMFRISFVKKPKYSEISVEISTIFAE
jgi:hypothetical protein